ncbi:MAG: hypothetical protein AAFX09_08795 [Pseudomonadota bacterium]
MGAISGAVLGAWFASQNAVRQAASAPQQLSGASANALNGGAGSDEVVPPWDPRGEVRALDEVQRSVLASGVFFDPELGAFSDVETGEDEKTLFAMYQGLRRLQSLAAAASDKSASDVDRQFWDRRFQEGVTQLDGFFEDMTLEGVSVLRGEELSKAESTLAISRGASQYTTGVIHSGAFDAEVDAFQGDTQFTITVRKNGVDTDVAINLDDMGATPRTLDSVADHINTQLEAASMLTRFERVKIGEEDENGVIQGDRYGFKIQGILTEQVSFSETGGQPAVYMAGISGDGETAAGQFTKFVDLASGGSAAFSRRIEPSPVVTETTTDDGETETSETNSPLNVDAVARSQDGGLFVVGRSSNAIDGQSLRGEEDLVLMRYDSTGKRVWARTLGAAGEAAGASVAVNAAGDVVVAGKVSGALGDTTDVGGTDSLVVKYDAAGVEQWARRFGGIADDAANAVSIGDDGTVFVSGQARSNLGGAINTGGQDGYVRAFGADGDTLYTRSAGSGAGDQRVKASAVASDGGLILAIENEGRAELVKYAAGDDGSGAPVWTLDLGDLDDGRIGGLAVGDDGAIYLSGAAGPAFAPGAVVTANAGGRDAMLTRISDGASASVDYVTFLGSAQDNSASSISVADGKVYLAGKTSDALPGGVQNGARNAFAAGFDAATGAHEWTQQISGRGGLSEAAGLVVDPGGDGALNRLGLPTGAVTYSDTRVVTDRSSVRDGDHFFVSVDGGRKQRITIDAGDTMRSLTFKLNAAFVLDATADVRRSADGDMLRITPKEGVTVEFFKGGDGQNALTGLGLPEGAVTGKASLVDGPADSTSDAPDIFALELPSVLSITDRDAALAAGEALTSAMSKVQRAYRELTLDPALRELLEGPQAGNRDGVAPAYLTAQVANYQAGLDRLIGGSGGGTLALF